MSLRDRVAIVTGATGAAGRAVVEVLALEGARVALIGTRRDRLEAVTAELGLDADRWLAQPADLRDATAAREAVEAVVARCGRLDILVHLVGGWTGGTSVADTPDDPFASMLDQHLWTTLNIVRAAVPVMTGAGWGRIVAVTTPVAAEPLPRLAPYAVGKAAEEALLGTLAREVAGTGVTVNLLRVRSIDTAGERDAAPAARSATSTTPAEIAAAIRYLCSDAARAVNGARIPLYGGG